MTAISSLISSAGCSSVGVAVGESVALPVGGTVGGSFEADGDGSLLGLSAVGASLLDDEEVVFFSQETAMIKVEMIIVSAKRMLIPPNQYTFFIL